jgi:hypothetical protein
MNKRASGRQGDEFGWVVVGDEISKQKKFDFSFKNGGKLSNDLVQGVISYV